MYMYIENICVFDLYAGCGACTLLAPYARNSLEEIRLNGLAVQ